MTSYFPDLNVWLALSAEAHLHEEATWDWFSSLPQDSRLSFCRYTQVGLLRLLTNQSVMGQRVVGLQTAWNIYDRWLSDPRIRFVGEPSEVDVAMRSAMMEFGDQAASKMVGDCYLLALAQTTGGDLVTFDQGLASLGTRLGHVAISLPNSPLRIIEV